MTPKLRESFVRLAAYRLQVPEIMRAPSTSLRTYLPVLLVLGTPAVAAAHIQLQNPLPRTLDQKIGPCGNATSPRSASPTVLPPGATITVTWKETINHPGHYRISFDEDGTDFTIPLSFTDTTQTENVLVDSIADSATANSTYTQEITLPDVECENCTLQLIQMMTDKPPYGDGNDIYFSCADIALRTGAPMPPDGGVPDPSDPDAGADDPDQSFGDATGGCSTTGGTQGLGMLGVALAVVLAWRRRSR